MEGDCMCGSELHSWRGTMLVFASTCDSLAAMYSRPYQVAVTARAIVHAGRCAILFVGPAHDDPERIIRQRPLQRLSLNPWRAHPNIALLIRDDDHRPPASRAAPIRTTCRGGMLSVEVPCIAIGRRPDET